MARRLRVLFVEHAHGRGGAMVSLLATVAALDPARYACRVALARPSAEVAAAYRAAGVTTLAWPGLGVFTHLSGVPRPLHRPDAQLAVARELWAWRHGEARMRALVRAAGADVVHLNSVILAPAARALSHLGVPWVWHVREHPPPAWCGARTALIRHLLRRAGDRALFLSEADRAAWGMADLGTVLPDFVCPMSFAPPSAAARAAHRRAAGIAPDAPVVAYLGGLTALKGITPMLAALAVLRRRLPTLVCVAPGALPPPPRGPVLRLARAALPWLGRGTQVQRAEQDLRRLGLMAAVRRTAAVADIRPWLACADALAFPATAPHFARPVIEAAVMGLPSVASDLAGPRELVVHGRTGYLVPANDARALAGRLAQLLLNSGHRATLGAAARARAQHLYTAPRAASALACIYARALRVRGHV